MTLSISTAVICGCSPGALPTSASGGAMDLPTSSKSPFGVEAVAGVYRSSLCSFSTRKGVKSVCVNSGKCCNSISALRKASRDVGRAGCARFTNGVNRSPSRRTTLSRRPRGVYSSLVKDAGDVKFDEITETKEEVMVDASQKPRLTYEDKAGKTKLISVQDYMEQAPELIKPDSGPPRWFCSSDAKGYPPDAPILLFIPGMDSIGLGLLLHQRKLARLFEVQCLHVPLNDRTSFVGLLEIIEQRIREEYDRKPGPIYLLAESFGGCLALSVAARNPELDLVLIVANPATSFEDSPLQPFLPLLQLLPDELFRLTPFLLSFTMGDPIRMASASVDSNLSPWEKIPKVAEAMAALLPTLPVLADIMPREVLVWKIKLIEEGARYTNSRLSAVKADILLLVSGNDRMLPSADEAKRLKKLLPQTKLRYFPNSGHTLLLEEGLNVASLIKVTQFLRFKKKARFDPVKDFRPPFPDEVEAARNGSTRVIRQIFSPVFLTSTEDGRVRRGLPQLPENRPLLFVSNHTLIGFDLGVVVEELLQKKGVLLRGLAHPKLSIEQDGLQEPGGADVFRLFGSVPVTGSSLYKLLARGEAALLYPGGVREALKRKGELYKLFWSESAEFVRTAIRHGATIVPFASVGGDDIVEIVLDGNELLSLPFLGDYIRKSASKVPLARSTGSGEVLQESFVTPLGYPKLPPRMYFMFRKPISTDGMLDSINDRVATQKLYMKVKGEVESGLKYVLENRTKDPYKDFIPRALYEVTNDNQAPTFDF